MAITKLTIRPMRKTQNRIENIHANSTKNQPKPKIAEAARAIKNKIVKTINILSSNPCQFNALN
jgi:hypothetical protein